MTDRSVAVSMQVRLRVHASRERERAEKCCYCIPWHTHAVYTGRVKREKGANERERQEIDMKKGSCPFIVFLHNGSRGHGQ